MTSRSCFCRFSAGCLTTLFLAAAIALFPWAVAAQTQPAPAQAKLASVSQTGSQNYSSEQVASLSGLQIGALVGHSDIQDGADRLARSGLFSSVRYHFSTDANGLAVTFELQDAPSFPISLDNFPWLTNDDFTSILKDAGASHPTAPASGLLDDRIAQTLQKALAAKGVNATVSYSVMSVPGTDDRVLQFRSAGSDVRVSSVQFSDPLAAHDSSVQSALSTIIIGKPFSIEGIERFDFEHVRPTYLSHSYLHVKFSAPSSQLSSPTSVAVTVAIEPGPSYVWGGVTWSGNNAYTTSDLDSLVKAAGLTVGQPLDGNKVIAMWPNILAAYQHRGYIDATVQPREAFDEATHRASYQVNISEGGQYHMGNLVLTGLSIDSERRVREAWRIPQGQIFDQTYCDQFLSQGIAEALKGLPAAQDTVGHFLQKNPQQKTVDVMIDFE